MAKALFQLLDVLLSSCSRTALIVTDPRKIGLGRFLERVRMQGCHAKANGCLGSGVARLTDEEAMANVHVTYGRLGFGRLQRRQF